MFVKQITYHFIICRSYKCLYRSTYSLLCCDGGAMPALVQDSMDSPTPEPDVNDFWGRGLGPGPWGVFR